MKKVEVALFLRKGEQEEWRWKCTLSIRKCSSNRWMETAFFVDMKREDIRHRWELRSYLIKYMILVFKRFKPPQYNDFACILSAFDLLFRLHDFIDDVLHLCISFSIVISTTNFKKNERKSFIVRCLIIFFFQFFDETIIKPRFKNESKVNSFGSHTFERKLHVERKTYINMLLVNRFIRPVCLPLRSP